MTYPSLSEFIKAKTDEYVSQQGMDGMLTWLENVLREAALAGIEATEASNIKSQICALGNDSDIEHSLKNLRERKGENITCYETFIIADSMNAVLSEVNNLKQEFLK